MSAKVVEGWQGKAKGLLQVLWERGFINATNLENYTMNRRQDACGIPIPDTSLKLLMANCVDFAEKESLLQANGRETPCLCRSASPRIPCTEQYTLPKSLVSLWWRTVVDYPWPSTLGTGEEKN